MSARFIRYIKNNKGVTVDKEYPTRIADLQLGDAIFLSEPAYTPEKVKNANSILAEKGLCIANYKKELVNDETGEVTIYLFVGKPMTEAEW